MCSFALKKGPDVVCAAMQNGYQFATFMADQDAQGAAVPADTLRTLFLNLGLKVDIAGDEMTREEFIALRKSLHLTQEEIAKALGVHVQTVKRAEGKDRAGRPIPTPLKDSLELALIKGLLRLKEEDG